MKQIRTTPKLHKHLIATSIFKKIFAIFIFIALPILGFYFGLKYQKINTPASISSITKVDKTSEKIIILSKFSDDNPNTILQSIVTDLNEKGYVFSQPKEGKIWWVSDDKWNIYSNSYNTYAFIKPTLNNGCVGKGNNLSCSEVPEIIKLNSLLSSLFQANGYIKNILNSSKSLKDESLYDYQVAFQKNNTKCVLITNADGGYNEHLYDVEFSIKCTTANDISEAYQEQLPYLKAIKAYGTYLKDFIVNIPPYASEGNIQNVSFHFRRTGASAIIRKYGDYNYKVLFTTTSLPTKEQCQILKDNNAPAVFTSACE